jgi:hypothetical protein
VSGSDYNRKDDVPRLVQDFLARMSSTVPLPPPPMLPAIPTMQEIINSFRDPIFSRLDRIDETERRHARAIESVVWNVRILLRY